MVVEGVALLRLRFSRHLRHRCARAWTELFGTLLVDGRPEEYSGPLRRPSEATARYEAMLSEDGTELRGKIEWYGYVEGEPPPVIPDDPDNDSPRTEPYNPNPDAPIRWEPAVVVDTCKFMLRRE